MLMLCDGFPSSAAVFVFVIGDSYYLFVARPACFLQPEQPALECGAELAYHQLCVL